MKLIGPLQGYAAFRETIEEYLPKQGVVQNEIIELISRHYAFQSFPRLPPGSAPTPILIFSGGKFESGADAFAISQLVMHPNGDVVVALTTEQAETVLNDLIRLLDSELGFRLGESQKKKSLLSNLVVQFDVNFETQIAAISKICDIVNAARGGEMQVALKRLSFGHGDIEQTNDPLEMVERADFLIERRKGATYAENRFFCSAPLSTTDHVRVLEEIEAVTLAQP